MTLEATDVVLFRLPKEHAQLDDCEDAASFDRQAGLFAVADGATSSPRAGEWATWLSRGFVSDPFCLSDGDAFGPWLDRQLATWSEHDEQSPPVASGWWTSEVERRGSWSTVNMCQLSTSSDADCVRVGSIGDALTFVIRAGGIADTFPRASPGEFNSTPELVGSVVGARDRAIGAYEHATLATRAGDVILMCTDALAEVVLRDGRGNSDLLEVVTRVDDSGFAELIARAREHGAILDDDVTMLRFRLRDPDEEAAHGQT